MKQKLILFLLCLILFTINYSTIDFLLIETFQEGYEIGIVQRIIDGDTIKINNESIRLLGINAPERRETFYEESKGFLEKEILNQEVQIHFGKTKFDKYKRKLGYIFLDNENINLKSVKEGYSNYYFPSGKNKYYSDFQEAWEICLMQNENLCKKSNNNCLILTNWNIQEQKIVLQNNCFFQLDVTGWTIKDEGRKKYAFTNKILQPKEEIILTPKDWAKDYVWTKTGDSIFIRDMNNELVLFDSY